MSHFTVYVFENEGGRDVESLLAPYDESIVYPPYIEYTKKQAIAKKLIHMNYTMNQVTTGGKLKETMN